MYLLRVAGWTVSSRNVPSLCLYNALAPGSAASNRRLRGIAELGANPPMPPTGLIGWVLVCVDIAPEGLSIWSQKQGVNPGHSTSKASGTRPASSKAVKAHQAICKVDQPYVKMMLVFNPPLEGRQYGTQFEAIDVLLAKWPLPTCYDAPAPEAGRYTRTKTMEFNHLGWGCG